MTSKTFNSGDVILKNLYLSSLDGDRLMDLREQTHNIDIYESILSPIITGSLSILDKISLRENFPIIGGKCKIKIEFMTPSDNAQARIIEFVVTEVNNVVIDPNGKGNAYDLSLASVEILENAKSQFKIPLIGNTIEDYVKIILTDVLKTKKTFNKESNGTKGQQRMDVVYMKPFQAIDMLKQKAVSKIYKSNVYSFFENKSGFNFVPIEYMLSADEKLIKDAIFFYDSDVNTDVKNTTFRNILAYNHIVQESPAKLVHEGALKNVTNQLDIRTRTKQTVEYDYSKAIDEFKTSKGARPIHKAKFESEYGKLPAMTFNVIKNSVMPETYTHEKLGYAQAYISMLTQNILRLLIWGDTYLSAGYRVRVESPKTSGLTKVAGKPINEKSDFVSGEFLISHLRHNLSRINTGYRHLISMELVNITYGRSGAFDT